jgi:hypothetical protein
MNRDAIRMSVLMLAGLVAMGVATPTFGDQPDIVIDGLIGFGDAEEGGYLAVFVPLARNLAVASVAWYNNDGTVTFPEILVEGGSASGVSPLSGTMSVATNVDGSSLSWSEVAFEQPVTTDNEGLYVVFRVPAGADAVSEGTGGGAAIGYTHSDGGCIGWLSADGEDWMQIHPGFGLAVVPTIVAVQPGMAAKSNAVARPRRADVGELETEDPIAKAAPLVTGLVSASPNPFNPRTTLSFALEQDEDVALAVYSVRGELVRQLVAERMSQGAHSVVWDGTDRRGLSVASGVYLARFTAGSLKMTQRLVLMR